ncbi:MAG TPA: hypothetical protein PKD91_07280, partial [Bacteroidia bacterium]|nr:hypothetical protein [Bacteroidia bacterium]
MNNNLRLKSPGRFVRWVTAMMLLTLCGFSSMAQVSQLLNPTYGYIFTSAAGTYTPLSGGTVFQSGTSLNTDGVSGSISLPFAFTYNGIKENNIFISNNGFITFASAPAVGNYVPLSTTTTSGYDGAIAGSGMNCVASTASGAAPEIRYGSNGGGDYVVQFQDIGQSSFAGIRLTYQIILKADGKTVQIVYGPNNVGVASANQCQVGLRGTNDEDWNNRTLSSGGNWNTTGGAAGSSNTSAMTLTASSTLPTSGLTFTWTPNAYVPTYLANAGGVVQEFTTWANGPGPGNIPTTNFATNGYGNASWQIDNTTATTTTSGWTGTAGAYTPADYVNASGGHSARFHAQLANSPQVGILDYYVDLSAIVGTPTLDFYHINTSGTDILQIFLSTNGGATFAQIGANIGVSASWTAKSISLGGANSATTIIRFKATSDFGSTDIGIDHMLVTPPPVLPTISSFTPNTNLCSSGGQTVTISGTGFTGTTSVTFNLVNAASFVVVNNSTITAVTPAGLTPGTIVVTNSVGPATSGSYTVVTAPTVTVSPTSASMCSPGGTPVTLTAGGAVSYSWNPTSGLTPTSGSPVSANPTSTTTYTVTGTDANGCTNTASSVITVSAFPAAVVITPSSPTVCSGTTQMLTSTGGPANSGTSSTIGSGTAFTTATGEQTAFCNRRVNYVGQTIYTAAELISAGVLAGSNITSMAYNISSNGDATTNANFTVKIGHVGSTVNFPSTAFFANGAYTTVFGPATYTHSAPGFQTITFSTPFVWDGSSNICIDVRHDGIDAINNAQTQFTTTAGNASIFGFNTPASGTLSTSRLNIRLGYLTPATSVVWTPTTNLFTDAGATVAYTGSPSTNVVYFNGTSTTSYSVTSTNAAGCTTTGGVTVTVTPLSCSAATYTSPNCAGSNFTVTANTTGGGAPYSYVWSDGVGGVYPNAATITA